MYLRDFMTHIIQEPHHLSVQTVHLWQTKKLSWKDELSTSAVCAIARSINEDAINRLTQVKGDTLFDKLTTVNENIKSVKQLSSGTVYLSYDIHM